MIDRQVILAVVYMVGGVTLMLAGGIIYSSVTGKPVDNGLSTLAGTALGYLGGILTNVGPRRSNEPTSTVTIPFQPPPVTEIKAQPATTEE